MTDDLIEKLRDQRERFIFQGGSLFALTLANDLETLKRLLQEAYDHIPDYVSDAHNNQELIDEIEAVLGLGVDPAMEQNK